MESRELRTAQRALRSFRFLQRLVTMDWPMRLANPLMRPFNPFLSEYRANPYPTYHALRRHEPVHFHRVLRAWLLSRHEDMVTALRDPRLSVDRTKTRLYQALDPERTLGVDFTSAIVRSLLMVDPPDHTRMRRLVNKAFTPRVVDGMRPRISSIVDDLLDAAQQRGSMEVIGDFAYPLPVIVIAEMLGVPSKDREMFKVWSDELTALLDPFELPNRIPETRRAYAELRAYFDDIFEQRRKQPRDDLISSLVRVEHEGDMLDATELFSITMLILGAGHETTTNLIGNAVLALLENPHERRHLVDDPQLIESAVEEFLRYDSPVQTTDRVATEDLDIGGKRIRRGEIVGILLGAANRDPDVFPDPDRLDLSRPDNRHIAFGQGPHYCLGAALARVEAQIAISALLRRFPNLSRPPGAIEWKRSIVLRGVVQLPVELGRAP